MSGQVGRFVVIEGADGCGKSTQATRLADALRARGLAVKNLREPGSTRLGEAVRGLLLERGAQVSVRAEALLYLAARAQMVDEILSPTLASGTSVVCERWTWSTEVYQGIAGELGAGEIRRVASLAQAGTEPDLVLVLDVAVGEGLRRLDGEPDRMEAKGEEFHARVVEGYRRLAAGRERHVVVPPGPPDDVAGRVLEEVGRLFD